MEELENLKNSFTLRVVVPNAFIKPPYFNMTLEEIKVKLGNYIDVPEQNGMDKDKYKDTLLRKLKEKADIKTLQKSSRIGCLVMVIMEDDDLQCSLPPRTDNTGKIYFELNKFPDEEQDLWKEYGTNTEPVECKFGLIYFNSKYRFDFRIPLKDCNRLSKIRIIIEDIPIQKKGTSKNLRLDEGEISTIKIKRKNGIEEEMSLKNWTKDWKKKKADRYASFKISTKKNEHNINNEKETNFYKPGDETWMKVDLFLFKRNEEKYFRVPSDKTIINKNEWPVMPDEQIESLEVEKITPIILMFKRFNDPASNLQAEIIDFALSQCHIKIWEEVFALCLIKSHDPIYTALLAAHHCKEKSETTLNEDWLQKLKASIEITKKLAGFIPILLNKQKETHYYTAAAKNLLDKNSAYAVEEEFTEICSADPFVKRANERWLKRSQKIVPFFPKISPLWSITCQGLFFLVFCILLTFVSTMSYGSYNKVWQDYFDNNLFGIQDEEDPMENSFWEISSFDLLYDWIDSKLIPMFFLPQDDVTYDFYYHHWILATKSINIRQIRASLEPCSQLPQMECYGDIMSFASQSVEATGNSHAGALWYNDLGGQELLGLSPSKRFHRGGYAVFLNGSDQDALNVTKALRENNYLDEATRAVIIEFAIYSPNEDVFLVFEILVEFTHLGYIHKNKAQYVIQPNDRANGLEYSFLCLLLFFILGYILQEGAELIVTGVSKTQELEEEEKSKLKENIKEEDSNLLISFKIVLQSTIYTIYTHYGDVWNKLDTSMNVLVLAYLSIIFIQRRYYSIDPYNTNMADLWYTEILIQTYSISGAAALAVCWLRVMYFALPIKNIGPLVIGMLRMSIDVAYWVFLMIVFVLGLNAAYHQVASDNIAFTGPYDQSMFNTILLTLGNIPEADTQNITPLPLHWFGNTLTLIAVLITVIILVTLLVAMMGKTFGVLIDTLVDEWYHLNFDLLLHYERFVLVPPPFNVLHFLIYFICLVIPPLNRQFLADGSWTLVGAWSYSNTWKKKKEKSLKKEYSIQPGGLNKYSTAAWIQHIEDEVEKEVEEKLNQTHNELVNDIIKLWLKEINKEIAKEEEESDEEDKGSDDKGSGDEGGDDEGSADEGSDDKGSDDKGSDDKGSDDDDSDKKEIDEEENDETEDGNMEDENDIREDEEEEEENEKDEDDEDEDSFEESLKLIERKVEYFKKKEKPQNEEETGKILKSVRTSESVDSGSSREQKEKSQNEEETGKRWKSYCTPESESDSSNLDSEEQKKTVTPSNSSVRPSPRRRSKRKSKESEKDLDYVELSSLEEKDAIELNSPRSPWFLNDFFNFQWFQKCCPKKEDEEYRLMDEI